MTVAEAILKFNEYEARLNEAPLHSDELDEFSKLVLKFAPEFRVQIPNFQRRCGDMATLILKRLLTDGGAGCGKCAGCLRAKERRNVN